MFIFQAGGALYVDEGVVRINGSKLVDNKATLVSGTGGAIFSVNSDVVLDDTVFLNNRAGNMGSAVRVNCNGMKI